MAFRGLCLSRRPCGGSRAPSSATSAEVERRRGRQRPSGHGAGLRAASHALAALRSFGARSQFSDQERNIEVLCKRPMLQVLGTHTHVGVPSTM